jgi:CBS domain-containing protein
VVGQIIAVLFIAFGILRFFQGAGLGGLWIAFIGWFLLQAAGATYLQVRAGGLLRGLVVKDLMSTECAKVDRGVSVQEFVDDQLLRTGRRCFFVMEDDRMVGLITANEVSTVPADRWPYITVRELMRPIGKLHVVSIDTPATEALQIMGQEDVNQLPVMSNGRVEGIVTRAALLEVLSSRATLNFPRDLPHAA